MNQANLLVIRKLRDESVRMLAEEIKSTSRLPDSISIFTLERQADKLADLRKTASALVKAIIELTP